MSGAEELEFRVVFGDEVAPWSEDLRALERGITYPIGDGADRFYIDHGERYHAFFAAMGPRSGFLLVLHGGRAVGSMAGALKEVVDAGGRRRTLLYLGDLKLHPDWRGRGVIGRMCWWGLRRLPFDPEIRGWELIFAAAMRGERGDVRRSARGLDPLGAVRPCAELALWFLPPERLLELEGPGPPPPSSRGLLLSPAEAPLVADNTGRKDFRLVSTGAPWPLCHLPQPPGAWGEGLGCWLRRAGEELQATRPQGLACFALDRRLEAAVGWMEAQGCAPGATATVYTFGWPHRRRALLRDADWVHLASSEI